MTEPVKTVGNVSLSTYQGLDGRNFTLCGAEEKYKFGKGYASAFLGAATDFNTEGMFVLDVKGGYDYDKNGIFNQNLRIRNKMGKILKQCKSDILHYQSMYLSGKIQISI